MDQSQPQEHQVSDSNVRPKDESIRIAITLLLFFYFLPIGMLCMWFLVKSWPVRAKLIVTIVFAINFVIVCLLVFIQFQGYSELMNMNKNSYVTPPSIATMTPAPTSSLFFNQATLKKLRFQSPQNLRFFDCGYIYAFSSPIGPDGCATEPDNFAFYITVAEKGTYAETPGFDFTNMQENLLYGGRNATSFDRTLTVGQFAGTSDFVTKVDYDNTSDLIFILNDPAYKQQYQQVLDTLVIE